MQPGAHKELATREWPLKRVPGRLSNRTVTKAAGKDVTAEEAAVVAAQRAVCGSIYQILRRAGAKSTAIYEPS